MFLLIFLSQLKRERTKSTETVWDFPSSVSLPKCSQYPGINQAKTSTSNSTQVSYKSLPSTPPTASGCTIAEHWVKWEDGGGSLRFPIWKTKDFLWDNTAWKLTGKRRNLHSCLTQKENFHADNSSVQNNFFFSQWKRDLLP